MLLCVYIYENNATSLMMAVFVHDMLLFYFMVVPYHTYFAARAFIFDPLTFPLGSSAVNCYFLLSICITICV